MSIVSPTGPSFPELVEYHGIDGLNDLESEWRGLYARMEHPTSYDAWEVHAAYLEHLAARPSRFRCIALREEGVVSAICPLEAATDALLGLAVPVWRLPRPPHMPTADIVCVDDAVRLRFVPALIAHLRRAKEGRPLLVLGPFRLGSGMHECVKQLGSRDCCENVQGAAAYFDCTVDMDVLMGRLTRHFSRNLRSHRRRLASLEGIRFVQATNPAEVARLFESFLDLEASGWKGPTGARTAILCKKGHPAFFRRVVGIREGDDRYEMNAIYLGDRCVAGQLCSRVASEYTIHKIGFDEGMRKLGPGQVLLEATLERCVQDPCITRLDLLSDSAWSRDWEPDVTTIESAYVSLKRLWSLPLMMLLQVRVGPARRAIRRMRSRSDGGHRPAEPSHRAAATGNTGRGEDSR